MSGIEVGNNKTSYTVTNLRPFTVYSFRIIAVNSLGPSKPSKESYYMVTLREGLYTFYTQSETIKYTKFNEA
jgi:receptor-type tyrosine-protein phosphatase gamma